MSNPEQASASGGGDSAEYLRNLIEEAADHILALCAELTALRARVEAAERLREALTIIARGEGRYSRDPLTHASNTIEDMVQVATAALTPSTTPTRTEP